MKLATSMVISTSITAGRVSNPIAISIPPKNSAPAASAAITLGIGIPNFSKYATNPALFVKTFGNPWYIIIEPSHKRKSKMAPSIEIDFETVLRKDIDVLRLLCWVDKIKLERTVILNEA